MKDRQQKPDPIIEMLDTLKETPERDPQRAARSRQEFLSQVDEISQQTVSISWFQRLINVFRIPGQQIQFSTFTIGLILGLLLVAFSGSVAAARQALPDQFLYPYKLWLEDQRLALTSNSASELELRLNYAEERLAELEEMDHPLLGDDLAGVLNNFNEHVTAAEVLISDNPEDEAQMERLRDLLEYSDDDDEKIKEMQAEQEHEDEEKPEPSETAKPTKEPGKTPSPEETDTPERTEVPEETRHAEETDRPDNTDEPEETDSPDDPDDTEDPDETEKPDETEEP